MSFCPTEKYTYAVGAEARFALRLFFGFAPLRWFPSFHDSCRSSPLRVIPCSLRGGGREDGEGEARRWMEHDQWRRAQVISCSAVQWTETVPTRLTSIKLKYHTRKPENTVEVHTSTMKPSIPAWSIRLFSVWGCAWILHTSDRTEWKFCVFQAHWLEHALVEREPIIRQRVGQLLLNWTQ